ncbi:interferon-induced, double-stranded RNA-activated protein kinase [Colletotrichum liriopes]|uniref:Interferon-induced, double-stranded RNA-activated protein kinase n=1 Tax=Colletotrichum liriopes TaxID=708192 RepID=A0AA37LY30_9PEZI|nr:interferon-induced, double-stranded RNA-activated protein kinase [Colletotrichum liriopes]
MPPKLVREGKIEILGQTSNSVVYAVADDCTALAHNSQSVLKGGTVWYQGREALGPGMNAEESNMMLQREARIYDKLGQSDRILKCHGLELLPGSSGNLWALRFERAPYGDLRKYIISNPAPDTRIRLQLAIQLAEGVDYIHERGIIWGDLSTRNVLLFDNLQIKLSDFANSALLDQYPPKMYGCEARYSPPSLGNDRSESDIKKREMFALGTGICEISEWCVPYGSGIGEGEVMEALKAGKFPTVSGDNPAQSIIRQLWSYKYGSTHQVLVDLCHKAKVDIRR